MRILLVGTIYRGAFDNLIYNNLIKLGVETEIVDMHNLFMTSFLNRILNKFLKTPHYFGSGIRDINKMVLDKASTGKFDFVLFAKPIFIYPKTIAEIKKYSKIIGLTTDHVDNPRVNSDYFYASMPLFDLYFAGRRDIGEIMYKLGAKKVYYFWMHSDPSCHYPINVSATDKKKLGADIVFLGTYAKNEKRVEYMELLCQEGYDIKIYGNSWNKLPMNSCLRRKNKIITGDTPCEAMSKIINSSKIVLAFMRESMGETIALRTSEIALCRGFMLHQRTEEAEKFFVPDKEAVLFDSYEEMKEKIDFYLKHPELRNKIAQAGYEKILNGGSLNFDMVKKLVSILKNEIGDSDVAVPRP